VATRWILGEDSEILQEQLEFLIAHRRKCLNYNRQCPDCRAYYEIEDRLIRRFSSQAYDVSIWQKFKQLREQNNGNGHKC
jgi:hypothetical protein